MKSEKHGFEAEVSRLLHMMVHSVYSEREIFLRELISNASDACDKLRYEGLTNEKLLDGLTKDEQEKAEKASMLTARYLWNFLSGMTTKHKLQIAA